MGAVCDQCTTTELQFQPAIQVSKLNFASIEPKPELIDQVKQLIKDQLPEDFKDYSFYQKGEDCYFIGNIDDFEHEKFGVLFKPNQTLYCGNFVNGFFNGKGTLKLINQNLTFQGNFNYSKPAENGKIQDEKHTFEFNGIWDNKFQPKSGTLELYQDKVINNIKFLDFQRNNVEISYKNGSVYKGFINKNTLSPEGIGKMIYSSGDIYDGEWVDGKFQGIGTYTWRNGQNYHGEYKNGMRNGEGTLNFSQHKSFIGYWRNGHREGFGKLMQKNGIVLEKGVYKDDKFDYQATQTYLDDFKAKVPKERVQSQLLNLQKKEDKSTHNK